MGDNANTEIYPVVIKTIGGRLSFTVNGQEMKVLNFRTGDIDGDSVIRPCAAVTVVIEVFVSFGEEGVA